MLVEQQHNPQLLKSYNKVEEQQQQQQQMDQEEEEHASNRNLLMAQLPSLKEVASKGLGSQAEAQLLLQKLRQCQQQLPRANNGKEGEKQQQQQLLAQAREVKADALREVLDWLGSSAVARQLLNVDTMLQEELLAIVRENLFRPLPPNKQIAVAQQQQEAAGVVDPEEIANGGGFGACCLASDWPHLQLVYRLLLHLIDRIDLAEAQGLHQHIDGPFVGHILARFHSTDPREREQLKAVLHGLYSRMVPLRGEIRKQMGWLLLSHVYERQPWMGLAELMEILGNIVNGFNVPLKPEHRDFFLRVLLPLHKSHHGYIAYFAQLTYCVAVFLEKDPTLAIPAVKTLLNNWPRQCSAKEVLFMVELEELLARIHQAEFHAVCVPLFRELAKCAGSQHCRVAERAMHLWNNEHMLALVNGAENSRAVLMPIMFHALYAVSEGHWNDTIAALVFKTLKRLMTLEPVLFDELVMNYEKEQAKRQKHHIEHERRWKRLNEAVMEEEEKHNDERKCVESIAAQIDENAKSKNGEQKEEEGEGKENQKCPMPNNNNSLSVNNAKSAPNLKDLASMQDKAMKDDDGMVEVATKTAAKDAQQQMPHQIRRKHASGGAAVGNPIVGEPRRKSSPNAISAAGGYGYRHSNSSECGSLDSFRMRRASSAIAAYHHQQQQQRQQKHHPLMFMQQQHIR